MIIAQISDMHVTAEGRLAYRRVDTAGHPGTPSGFVMEPPACLLHVWSEAMGLVTHTSYIGDFGGPRPFRDVMHHPG